MYRQNHNKQQRINAYVQRFTKKFDYAYRTKDIRLMQIYLHEAKCTGILEDIKQLYDLKGVLNVYR